MKVLLIAFCFVSNLYSQDYKLSWEPVANAEFYKIYIWEGANFEDCPLFDSLEVITPEVELLEVDSTVLLYHIEPIALSGNFLKAAVIAFNRVDTSLMSAGDFHEIPSPLTKPVIIQDEILGFEKWYGGMIDTNFIYNLPGGSLPKRETGTYKYLKVDKNNSVILRKSYKLFSDSE